MANKSINTLDETTSLANADLLVLWKASANAAYSISGQSFTTMLTTLADGHGGIASITWTTSGTSGDGQYHYATIHYADDTTSTFTIRDGVKGDTGAQTYVWIRYAEHEPTADADIGVIPAAWMGIYIGLSSTAPTSYSAYTWYKIKGDKGNTGESISRIVNTSSSGLTDIYTVYTDADTNVGTFSVTNGAGGVSTVNEIAPDENGNAQLFVASVGDLTLNGTALVPGSAVIADAYSALAPGQVLMCPATDFPSGQLPGGQTNGTVEIVKTDSSTTGWIEFHGKTNSVGDYRMFLANDGTPSNVWTPTTAVTSGSFARNAGSILPAGNNITVERAGRLVTVTGYVTLTNAIATYQNVGTVSSGFTPRKGINVLMIPSVQDSFPVWCYLATTGDLSTQGIGLTAGHTYYCTITYIS